MTSTADRALGIEQQEAREAEEAQTFARSQTEFERQLKSARDEMEARVGANAVDATAAEDEEPFEPRVDDARVALPRRRRVCGAAGDHWRSNCAVVRAEGRQDLFGNERAKKFGRGPPNLKAIANARPPPPPPGPPLDADAPWAANELDGYPMRALSTTPYAPALEVLDVARNDLGADIMWMLAATCT